MKITPTKTGFNIQHTTREIWGVDDPHWKVQTKIPYFNYTKTFNTFEEAQHWTVTCTGVAIEEKEGSITYHALRGVVIVSKEM